MNHAPQRNGGPPKHAPNAGVMMCGVTVTQTTRACVEIGFRLRFDSGSGFVIGFVINGDIVELV